MYIFGNDKNYRGCFVAMKFDASAGHGARLKLPGTEGEIPWALESEASPDKGGDGTERAMSADDVSDRTFNAAQQAKRLKPVKVSPILVVGFDNKQSDAYSFVETYDRVYTYAFGHDPNASTASIQCMGFLVDKNQYSNVIGAVNSRYAKSRISASLSYASLVMGASADSVLQGFIVGISSNTADPQHGLQTFSIHMVLPEIQGAKGGK